MAIRARQNFTLGFHDGYLDVALAQPDVNAAVKRRNRTSSSNIRTEVELPVVYDGVRVDLGYGSTCSSRDLVIEN